MISSLFGGGGESSQKETSETTTATATATATNTMDEFIKQAASVVGVDEAQAKSFVGMVMEQIQKKSPEEVSAEIDTKISGARGLIDETMKQQEENEMLKPCMPVLDMLKNLIDQLTGGNAGMLEIVKKSGVSVEQGTGMLKKVLEFLQEKLGAETVEKITAKVPALTAVMA